jgi:hypothetical protein
MNRAKNYGMDSVKLWKALQFCAPIIFYRLHSNHVGRYYFKTLKYLWSLKMKKGAFAPFRVFPEW